MFICIYIHICGCMWHSKFSCNVVTFIELRRIFGTHMVAAKVQMLSNVARARSHY